MKCLKCGGVMVVREKCIRDINLKTMVNTRKYVDSYYCIKCGIYERKLVD